MINLFLQNMFLFVVVSLSKYNTHDDDVIQQIPQGSVSHGVNTSLSKSAHHSFLYSNTVKKYTYYIPYIQFKITLNLKIELNFT